MKTKKKKTPKLIIPVKGKTAKKKIAVIRPAPKKGVKAGGKVKSKSVASTEYIAIESNTSRQEYGQLIYRTKVITWSSADWQYSQVAVSLKIRRGTYTHTIGPYWGFAGAPFFFEWQAAFESYHLITAEIYSYGSVVASCSIWAPPVPIIDSNDDLIGTTDGLQQG